MTGCYASKITKSCVADFEPHTISSRINQHLLRLLPVFIAWGLLLCAAQSVWAGEKELMDRHQEGWSPLMVASWHGDLEAVRGFLWQGEDVNFRSGTESTPLLVASMKGYDRIVQMLLKYGADVDAANQRGNTAIMIAVQHTYYPVIRMLVDHEADIFLKNNDGDSAYSLAERSGNPALIRFLFGGRI